MTGSLVTAGLAPSATLTPSASLAPAAPVYSGGPITPHKVALACGTGGAWTDVTNYVEFGEGITYSYGRTDQFSDVSPGRFSFTLNNSDGRFTPGNTASPVGTTLTEGMGVCWQLGTRLVHTTILAIEIPPSEESWYQIRVTCDDMLGTAGRHQLTSIADGLTETYHPYLWWKLDEDSSAVRGEEQHGALLGAFQAVSSSKTTTATLVTFGQPQHPALPGTAVTVTAPAGTTTFFGTPHGNTLLKTAFPYPIPTDHAASYYFGGWSFWVYPGSTVNFAVTPYWAVGAGYSDSMQVLVTPTSIAVKGGVAAPFTHTYTAAEQGVPHYVELNPQIVWQTGAAYWALYLNLIMDGTWLGSAFMQSAVVGYRVPDAMLADGTAMQPLEVNFSVTTPAGATAPLSGTVQRVSHSLFNAAYVTLEQNALYDSEDERRAVLDTLSTDLSSAAYNGRASLWAAPIGYPDISNRSVLDVYNDIVRTEQGHMFCTTTGTLTNPVEQIQVRDRDRPTAVKAAFHVTDELDGLPTFVRDITNVAASVEVTGPNGTVTVNDPSILTVSARAITSGLSETVLVTDPDDLRLWGQDRLNRGKNVALRVQDFTVDAVTTPTDRSAALLGLVPGDRVQLTGLPSATLGFTTWDGWVIGGVETHTIDGAKFKYTVAPVLPATAVYDTDRYENDGDGYVNVTMTATDTTINTGTNTGAGFSTDVPYLIQIDNEQMTVTGNSAGILTVTRHVNGTTAATHASGAGITAVYSPLYAF